MRDTESMGDEEWHRIYVTALNRMFDDATRPFMIERFCAQLAWMSPKTCPVYPISPSSGAACSYLVNDGYEDYRCPNARLPMEIARPIIERGSQEQKEALEFLADMYARYGTMENPPFERDVFCVRHAMRIYMALGRTEKAEGLVDQFKAQFPLDGILLESGIRRLSDIV
jgi:hypothetical protein